MQVFAGDVRLAGLLQHIMKVNELNLDELYSTGHSECM